MERPKIDIEKTITDKMLEWLVYVGVIALWLYPAIMYRSLPDIIPTHFNASGVADDFSSKSSLWWLPAIATVVIAMLMLLMRVPHVLNYPVKITEKNAERQYRLATGLLRYLGLAFVIIFLFLEITTVQTALSNDAGTRVWLMPLLLVLTFGPVGFFVFKMLGNKL